MQAAVPKPQLFIDGQWITSGAGEQSLFNPATGEEIGRVPHASIEQLDHALESADRGFRQWRRFSAYERSNVMRSAAALIRARVDSIARQITLEQGKTLGEAKSEVYFSADTFDWYAEEGRRAYGRIVPSRERNQRWLVTKEPVGPVVAFSPWNFPALLSARKIAAALGDGCSCILKPAEETPSAALAFARALEDAGLPPGVFNVVLGVPGMVSSHLVNSPVIKKVTFTGSTSVGKHLARLAADGMKKATFELGGHAPVIVFDDVEIDQVVQTLIAGKVRNAGQVCVSPTRLYVQEKIFSAFTEAFSKALASVKVGNGLDGENQMGSLANPRRIDAMRRLVENARSEGGRVLVGGARASEQGCFWQPTLITEVPLSAQVMSEEPFGPLAVANPFATFDDAVEQANRLPFGLAAYAFTLSNRRSIDIADALECGLVGINNLTVSTAEAPFGGIKESGYGSEAGQEGLEAFLNTKFISEA